jgi:hypothetical protein
MALATSVASARVGKRWLVILPDLTLSALVFAWLFGMIVVGSMAVVPPVQRRAERVTAALWKRIDQVTRDAGAATLFVFAPHAEEIWSEAPGAGDAVGGDDAGGAVEGVGGGRIGGIRLEQQRGILPANRYRQTVRQARPRCDLVLRMPGIENGGTLHRVDVERARGADAEGL